MGSQPIGHEKIEVAQGAEDALVGGDEVLGAVGELGPLRLLPHAAAAKEEAEMVVEDMVVVVAV